MMACVEIVRNPEVRGHLRYGEGFGVWSAEKNGMCASDSNPKLASVGGTHTDEMPGQKARNGFLQQFLVNRDVAASAKSGLEGLQGPLFLLNDKLHANLF